MSVAGDSLQVRSESAPASERLRVENGCVMYPEPVVIILKSGAGISRLPSRMIKTSFRTLSRPESRVDLMSNTVIYWKQTAYEFTTKVLILR